jgi:hypothetical protein
MNRRSTSQPSLGEELARTLQMVIAAEYDGLPLRGVEIMNEEVRDQITRQDILEAIAVLDRGGAKDAVLRTADTAARLLSKSRRSKLRGPEVTDNR